MSIATMMERLNAGQLQKTKDGRVVAVLAKNPARFCTIGGENIPWGNKLAIQNAIDLMGKMIAEKAKP